MNVDDVNENHDVLALVSNRTARKRRRETSEQNPMDTLSNVQSLTISNLPDNLLGKIACYVEKSSWPLPAVALKNKLHGMC